MTEQEMMEVWTRLATPGPEHQLLARYTGNWKVAMKAWMTPGDPAMESTGMAKCSMMLDGRIRTEEFAGEAMGKPFKGWGMFGYDNQTQKWWMTWCDNMSTGIWCSRDGMMSADQKTVTFTGEMTRATTGKTVKVKNMYRLESEDHYIFESWEMGPTEQKTLEIDYRRK